MLSRIEKYKILQIVQNLQLGLLLRPSNPKTINFIAKSLWKLKTSFICESTGFDNFRNLCRHMLITFYFQLSKQNGFETLNKKDQDPKILQHAYSGDQLANTRFLSLITALFITYILSNLLKQNSIIANTTQQISECFKNFKVCSRLYLARSETQKSQYQDTIQNCTNLHYQQQKYQRKEAAFRRGLRVYLESPGRVNQKIIRIERSCPDLYFDLLQKRQGSGFKLQQILSIALSALKGLHGIHSIRYYHRDVEIENILIGKVGKYKLCDFGSCTSEEVSFRVISKSDYSEYLQQIESFTTPIYRPPEMADRYLNYKLNFKAYLNAKLQFIYSNPVAKRLKQQHIKKQQELEIYNKRTVEIDGDISIEKLMALYNKLRNKK